MGAWHFNFVGMQRTRLDAAAAIHLALFWCSHYSGGPPSVSLRPRQMRTS